MKLSDIHWEQGTTHRGVVLGIGGVLAVICVFMGNLPGAAAIMGIAQTIVGALGIAVNSPD